MATLGATAAGLLTTVSEALSDAQRPVCKEMLVAGTPVIANCCECDDEGNSGELMVTFRRMFDADPATLNEVIRPRPCRGGVIAATFRVVLARCHPVINERGEVPDEETFTEYADAQMVDAQIVWSALAGITGTILRIDDLSVDPTPGPCSVLYADVTTQIDRPCPPDPGSL